MNFRSVICLHFIVIYVFYLEAVDREEVHEFEPSSLNKSESDDEFVGPMPLMQPEEANSANDHVPSEEEYEDDANDDSNDETLHASSLRCLNIRSHRNYDISLENLLLISVFRNDLLAM